MRQCLLLKKQSGVSVGAYKFRSVQMVVNIIKSSKWPAVRVLVVLTESFSCSNIE